MREINGIVFKVILLLCLPIEIAMAMPSAYAQCGNSMSCGAPPNTCGGQVCFRNDAAKQQFEQDNNCKFSSKGLCGDKPIDGVKQCCGKDERSGAAKIKDRQINQLNPKFDWASYQKECPNMRQSEGKSDAFWSQCVVGIPQVAGEYQILVVQPNLANAQARNYCIDGCSTPVGLVDKLYFTGIFLVKDRDNPAGFPGASFLAACSAHDVCYQSCSVNNNQDTCDTNLLDQSLQACEVIPKKHISIDFFGDQRNTYSACRNAANKMNTGLYFGGKEAFSKRRQQYCQCC